MASHKIENSEKFRSNIKIKLNEKIKNEKYSDNLERGIFNYTLKESDQRKVVKKWDNPHFVQIYLDRLRTIYINLNENIIQQMYNGDIKSHTVAFMTHQELMPDKWADLIAAKSKRDANKFENNIAAATDTFTCRKCKSKKCTYYLLQVRSSDEPMNCYVSCCDCGTRWKC